MTASTLTFVCGVIVAVALFLDIRLARHRPKIHNKFLSWWCWFAGLRIRQAISRSISIFAGFFDFLCGPKIFSVGAILRSVFVVTLVALVRFLWLNRNDTSPLGQHLLGIAIIMIPVIPPAVVVLIIVRFLFRSAARKPTFLRLLTVALANLVLVQLGIEILSFIYGLCAQGWIDTAYYNHVSVRDTEDVLATGFAFYFAFSHVYGYLALLPAIVFGALSVCWILIIIAAEVCRFIEEFLRLQVEETGKPFTAIAGAACMLLWLHGAVMLLPYTDIGRYSQSLEHRMNRWAFTTAEGLIRGPIGKRGEEYMLYDLRNQAFLIGIEAIGPTMHEIQNLRPWLSKLFKKWQINDAAIWASPTPAQKN